MPSYTLEHAPELEGADQETIYRRLRQHLTTGVEPRVALAPEPAAGSPPTPPVAPAPIPAPASIDGPIFDAGDLFAPIQRAERYSMPNGKAVWVHPVSVEEAGMINRRALAETMRLGIVAPDQEASRAQQGEMQVEMLNRARVWQAVFCCRAGPELAAARIFGPEHAAGLLRNPGYLSAIQEICTISDRLSEGKAETEVLRESLVRFFETVGRWLLTCAGLAREGQFIDLEISAFARLACSASLQSLPLPDLLRALLAEIPVRDEAEAE